MNEITRQLQEKMEALNAQQSTSLKGLRAYLAGDECKLINAFLDKQWRDLVVHEETLTNGKSSVLLYSFDGNFYRIETDQYLGDSIRTHLVADKKLLDLESLASRYSAEWIAEQIRTKVIRI